MEKRHHFLAYFIQESKCSFMIKKETHDYLVFENYYMLLYLYCRKYYKLTDGLNLDAGPYMKALEV